MDSWFLSLRPMKRLLLRLMKKSKPDGKNAVQRQTVYSFGDHYYFRKELKILNLLTGYGNWKPFFHLPHLRCYSCDIYTVYTQVYIPA